MVEVSPSTPTTAASATRSISQSEANDYFRQFFNKRNNAPAKYAELAQALESEFQANSNQISGLIHRSHAKDHVLIKNGKDYSLNVEARQDSSIIDQVKSQILGFKEGLDKSISLNDISSEKEFKELKEILKKLEELGQ